MHLYKSFFVLGKLFAYSAIKFLVASILRKFEVLADGNLQNIRLKADITVRALDGYNVRLKNRI